MKPLVFFDIESTGVDVAKDRIVSICFHRFAEFRDIPNARTTWASLFNPGIPIPPEATECHGITDEMVMFEPDFKDLAETVHAIVRGVDLAGYNLINFDIPLLWEELYRAGIEWDLAGVRVIDAGNIFKKKEERTLSAAVKFYCGHEHDSAHTADGDVAATVKVLGAQLARYPDLGAMDIDKLAEFSQFDKRADLAGKIVLNEAGDPVYNIGKSKGVRVVDDPGFGIWMLGKDFSEQTKQLLRKLLN